MTQYYLAVGFSGATQANFAWYPATEKRREALFYGVLNRDATVNQPFHWKAAILDHGENPGPQRPDTARPLCLQLHVSA